MRARKLWLGVLLVASSSALPIPTAYADRRTGLAGNILFDDPDDIFLFPQYTLLHRNMLRFDYGGTSAANNKAGDASGNGVLTLGNGAEAIGVAVHRGDLLTPDVTGFNQELAWLGGVERSGNPFGTTTHGSFAGPSAVDANAGLVLPATVLDLSYARLVGTNPLGVRLGFGRGVQAAKNENGEVTKGAQTFFAAQLGYSSLKTDALHWDLSGNAAFALGKATQNDVDQNTGWNLRVAGLGRAYYPINSQVDLGLIGNLSINNEHSKNSPASTESNNFGFGMLAAAGPVLHLDHAKLATYGGLRMVLGKFEANTTTAGDEFSRVRFTAPIINMALEIQIIEWMFVRTGAEYVWEVRRNASDNAKQRIADSSFRWSTGLGFVKGSLYFDGVITNELMTGGPNFIGGTQPGFLAMVSITYKFGDVFGHAKPPPAPIAITPAVGQTTPPPPPMPSPTPPLVAEPDQELTPPAIELTPKKPSHSRTRAGPRKKAAISP